MTKEKKSYDEEFEKTIVNLYESGKRMANLSREYGVSQCQYKKLDKQICEYYYIYMRSY